MRSHNENSQVIKEYGSEVPREDTDAKKTVRVGMYKVEARKRVYAGQFIEKSTGVCPWLKCHGLLVSRVTQRREQICSKVDHGAESLA